MSFAMMLATAARASRTILASLFVSLVPFTMISASYGQSMASRSTRHLTLKAATGPKRPAVFLATLLSNGPQLVGAVKKTSNACQFRPRNVALQIRGHAASGDPCR
jgi:hypothetical protein